MMKKINQRLLCLLLTLCTLLSVIPLTALPALASEEDTTESTVTQAVGQKEEAILFEENFDDVTERVSFVPGENTEGATAGWYYDRNASSKREMYLENGKLHVSGGGVDSYYEVLYRTGAEKWQNYTLEADFCYTDGNVGWGGIVYNHWGWKKLQKASFSGSTSAVTVALNGMNSKWTNDTKGVNSKNLTNDDTKAIVSGAPVRMKIVSHFESASLYYAMLNDDGTMKTDWIFVMSIDNIAEGAQQGSIGLMTSAGAKATNFWVDNIKCYANVYSEDFSYDDTELAANETSTEMGLQYIKTSTDGVAEIKNGALYMRRGDAVSEKKGLFDAVLFTEGTRWTDYVLEADYTYLVKEHSAWSGLAYRSVDVKNFQKAALTPSTPIIQTDLPSLTV